MPQPQADTATSLIAIEHLALRVADPEAMADFLVRHLGMERGESVEGFSVLGAPGATTRLFLLQADEPPEPGVLERVVLRVSDLGRAIRALPDDVRVQEIEPETVALEGPEGLGLGLTRVWGGGVDYDVDHLVMRVMDPDESTIAMAELGFVPRGGALHVVDKQIRLRPGIRSAGEAEPLSHLGVVVESVEAVKGQALRAGLQFDELTLEPNRLGVYVRGPERIRIEYSEGQ